MRACLGLLGVSLSIAAPPVSFQREVKPVLAKRCEMCHNASNASGGLSLSDGGALLKGGRSGPAVVAGNPDRSPLIAYVSGPKPRMPKVGPALSAAEVETIRRWIAEGAQSDETGGGRQVWWSLAPVGKHEPPRMESPWPRNAIDRFVLAKLQEAKLDPSPEADRRTLIRRVTFDLHGLPPTPEEVDAFLSDSAPDAYERLVARLLASPRYGERWARHWMDTIHYGESHGYDKDKPRLNAWPYRDWLIAALNEDKPYARFVQEQLAGDVLFADDPKAFAATGFLAAGPWDFVGHQELKEGTTDKDLTRVLDRDDMVATAMSAFTSTTAHCARCHDHKFDPIPQQDYYNLQAVFAGIDRADRPFDDDAAVHKRRQELLRAKRAVQLKLQPLLDKVEFASTPEIDRLADSIQDANLLIVHMGGPKTAEETERKKQLEARRTAERAKREQLVREHVGAETFAEIERIREEFKPIDEQLAALPKPRLVYSGAEYFARAGAFRPSLTPRPVNVLERGNVRAPGKEARPGALSAVQGLPARFELPDVSDEGARRAALAQWITHRDNPLAWRSIVNRVWQWHFGTGLVETANDFGRMGTQPSHAELLDWLAVWFRDEAKGSLKQLHRLMVTSAAYRQTSQSRPRAQQVDAENRLLWRMNTSRVDAEALRDAMLAAAGKLDLTMGGPAVQMFRFKDDHSPVYDYARFDPDEPGAHRRSIYRFIVRSVPDPFMERLDCPDPSVLTAKRSTTITAIQALAVWNNAFVLRMAEHMAERLRTEAGSTREQVALAFRLALSRTPAPQEAQAFAAYAERHGLANMCRVIFNTNEFAFVD